MICWIKLARSIPVDDITWVSEETQRLYDQVVELIRSSAGELNFHDALIALICREQGISMLVSFDQDFDRLDWLVRAGSAAEVAAALRRRTDESLP